jgi:hypothetical protein
MNMTERRLFPFLACSSYDLEPLAAAARSKKATGNHSPWLSLFSGNHTYVHIIEIQLKKDRLVPRTAEIPKIDIMKTRYFFSALMSTVNECMNFPSLLFKILFYYIVLSGSGQAILIPRLTTDSLLNKINTY